MKSTTVLLSFVTALAFTASSWAADVTVKLKGVHLCCNACVTGVKKAVEKIAGATTVVDKDSGVVAIAASNQAIVQRSVDALVAAGYFGKSDVVGVSAKAYKGGPEGKVQSLTVEGVHLCCGKCAKMANEAVAKVKGVTNSGAEKNSPSFEVKGDFEAKAVFAALEKAGMSGRAAK